MKKQQTTGLRGAAKDVPTIVAQACDKVNGFGELIQEMERSIVINGKSSSMFDNYSRQLAHLALYYGVLPVDLTAAQVTDYLYKLKTSDNVSKSFFRFTVFGLRYVCKMRGLEYDQFRLPTIKHEKKLPVVLSESEVKEILQIPRTLEQKLIISLLYGCGLRIGELCGLERSHVNLGRGMLHVCHGKGAKDRYIPLGKMLCRGLKTYLNVVNPVKYLFEHREATMVSRASISTLLKKTAQQAEILKPMYAHLLRHTFATHLIENGENIMTVKDLMGHERIETTMIYLHVARPSKGKTISLLDTLYDK